MRRKRAAARARVSSGAAVPASTRKALAGKLKRAAESLNPKPAKKSPSKKKKPATKKPVTKRSKVVGRITPKVKASSLPPSSSSRPVDPGGIILAALGNAEDIVLSGRAFSLHDSKQAIGIVRDALETIAVIDSHLPPEQVKAELSQFAQVVLDFLPPKRRADFRAAFQKALKAAT